MSYTKRATILAVAVMIATPFLHAAGHPAAGEQRRWTLNFRTRLEQPGAARPIEIALTGDWIMTVSAVRAGEYDAALELANLRLGVPGQMTADQLAFQRRLQRTYWATYRDNGSLAAIHFYKDTDPGDRNLLQMVATECQFVRGAGASWTARERDSTGEYLASYSRTDAHVLTKRKVKYISETVIQIDQSETRVQLDAQGEITSLDAASRAHLGAGKGFQSIAVVTEVHLSGLRKGAAPEIAGSLALAHSQIVTSPIRRHEVDPEQARARLDAQLLEGRSTESLLTAAFSQPADSMLPDRLAALFRQRPGAIAYALDRLRKNSASVAITDALGAAGSPAAIQTLGAIAGDRTLARAIRIDALSAFIQIQKPTVGAMQAPSALLDDSDAQVAAAARMAAGSLARAGRVGHPQEADALDAALLARYRQTLDAAQKVELLAAMGNSTGPAVVPVVEGALGDRSEAVRAAAARALRLAAGPEVDGLLAATIMGDRDAGVRSAAILAATFRKALGAKLVDALLRAAKSDPIEQVRTSAIHLLRQRSGAIPRFAETMTWIAANDPTPGVRRLAGESLKGL